MFKVKYQTKWEILLHLFFEQLISKPSQDHLLSAHTHEVGRSFEKMFWLGKAYQFLPPSHTNLKTTTKAKLIRDGLSRNQSAHRRIGGLSQYPHTNSTQATNG